jgi:hypothetical protein
MMVILRTVFERNHKVNVDITVIVKKPNFGTG